MRFFVFFLVLFSLAQECRGREARSYLVSKAGIYAQPVGGEGWLQEEKLIDFEELDLVTEAGFESRFVGEGDELRDLTRWAREMCLLEEEGGRALWNETRGRLVVWTDEVGHREVARHFKQFLEVGLKFRVRVLKVKGVTMAGVGLREADLPENVEMVGEISGELEEGRGQLDEGQLSVEMDAYSGADHVIWENRMTLRSKIPGAKFEIQGGYMGIIEEPMVLEIGALGGKESWVAVLTMAGVLEGGTPLRDWVLDEGGEGKWWKEALVDSVGPWKAPVFDGRRVRRRFTVPPTFLTFIGSGEDDPFSEDGEKPTAMELLKSNGVTFREGDSAIFYEKSSVLEVVASQEQMFLAEGIISHSPDSMMGMIRGSFVLVESKEKLTKDSMVAGRYWIREKVSHYLLGGQPAEIRLRRKALLSEVEAQVDSEDRLVEVRYDLVSKAGGSLKSGGTFEVGSPVIVQQEKVGSKWRAWVLTTSVLRLRDFLEDGE